MNKNICKICQKNTLLVEGDFFDDRYGAIGHHNIRICESCGYGQTQPGIPKHKIGEFYAKHYPISHIVPKAVIGSITIPSPLTSWLQGTNNIAHHATHPGEVVLDIGSASGVSLLEIGKLGGVAYGVEPDPSGKKLAKQLKLTVHQGFITDNPFPHLKFDLVTGSQVIEHEPEPLAFLLAIKDKLKKNGRVILSFPNYHALYRLLFGRRWIHYHIPYHLNFFTHRSVKLLAKKVGLRVVKLKTITPSEWTLLQARSLLAGEPQHGIPSSIWKKTSLSKPRSHTGIERYLDSLRYLLSRIFLIAIIPINRLLDSLGLGESFLVVMVKE